MAKMNKIMPPRNTTIRGQDHLLAYITPEEAQMLMDNGGAGKPGPMGIPAFYTEDDFDADLADSTGAQVGPSDGGMEPGRSQAQFGTTEFAGLSEQQAQGMIESGQASQQAMDVQSSLASQKSAEIAALEQLNKDLYDLSRKQEIAGLLAGKNINNMAAALVGYPPDLLSSINPFSDNKIGRGLDPETLAGLQSRGIRGPSGQITGVTDAFGNVIYGNDPNENYGAGDGFEPEVKPVNPETGQCDEGYMFDEDMQACRLAPVAMAERQAAGQPGAAYARMGLLDQTPTGLPQFQQRYGAGFGSPADFAAANMGLRRRGAYRPEFFKNPYPTTGYTLLS